MLRAPTALCLAVLLRTAAAQEIRINEVLCAHAWDATDRADRIELYNAGRTAVDLNGFTIALNGATHRIEGALMIPAHGFRVLFCDHHPERGNDHLDLKLPRGGGSVLLIAPDRTRMLDLFTWPALPAGVSMGRVPDGARNWAFFEQPTFGSANNAASARKRLLRAPILQVEGSAVLLTAEEGCTTRYTTDGTSPDVRSARYATALTLHNGEVLRARAFADDGIPSTEVVHTALLPPAAIALTIEPFQLDDPKQGLFANENYARKGREWERPALVEWPLANEARPMMHVGVAVSGSGTRSAPKKNLKLFARDRFGSESVLPFAEGSDELILRADATPHALLRNLFLERIALRSGRRVDVQPSTVLPLYVNGACFGAYRAMPAKNAAWVKRMGKAEAVDLIDGPGGHAIAGDDVRFRQMLGLLQRGAPIDSLEQLIDVNSLIELACFDLWTGRADHDLNVRCWRPRTADGRFRWILYDMDLWAATDDPTVDRMAQATTLEAPYLDQLLAHPDLRDRLLQRMSTLVATTLAPEQAAALADSLYRTHAELMRTDHERWKDTLSMPAPWEGLADLQAHVQGRAPRILDQLARHTGTDVRTITVQVEPRGAGTITLDGLAMG
ncbi:MAG TPA: CotH kinase family protein, partial [Flavobacteriales bacterium]|nr:CotH kinase family protein [Flavobacteriales bacterium]